MPTVPHLVRLRSLLAALLAALAILLFGSPDQAVAQWTFTKTPSPTTYTAAGQVITYTYRIQSSVGTNGSLDSLTDTKVSSISCPSNVVPANGTLTCTGSYTITIADLTAGSVTNVATASGDFNNDGGLITRQAQATVTFNGQASWTLSKTPNPTTYSAAGQVVNYSYVLTNTGTVAISAIAITDNKVSPVSCPAPSLAAGASMTCTGSYTIVAADLTNGSVTNTATATGTPAGGTLAPATTQATITFNGQPAWTLTKSASPTVYSAAGQLINYSYVLTNTGNVAIGAIAITDNKVAPVTCPATSLAAGAAMTCTGRYTTAAADLTSAGVTNTAIATGTPAGGTLAPATAQATITFVPPAPPPPPPAPPPPPPAPPATGSITITKTAVGGNDRFSFSSTLAEAGAFALETVGGTATRTFSNLTPGSYTFTEVSLPLNWNLSTLSCTGDTGGAPTTVSLANRSVSIGLDGGEAITCTFNNVFDAERHRLLTQEVIFRFLAHRLNLLIDNGPDRDRFIRRLPGSLWGEIGDNGFGASANAGGPFSLSGNSSAYSSALSFSTSLNRMVQAQEVEQKNDYERLMAYAMPVKAPPRKPAPQPVSGLDVWVEAHFSQFKAEERNVSNSGNFGVVYLGADYLVTSSILVGALVQYDWMDEKSKLLRSHVDGHGLMAGPYASMRITPNLFADARMAWGRSDNKVDPFGLYQDKFTTDRWLATANLTGNWQFGQYRFTPSAGLTYIEERQHSYIDTLGIAIPGQTLALGRFQAGPEIAYRYVSGTMILEPHVSIKGVWDFQRPETNTIGGLVVTGDEFSARLETGLLARAASGWAFRGVFSYDGVGSDRFHALGGKVWLNIPFH